MKNYYEILGVEKTSTLDEISKAYRKLARQYHPDANPGDTAVVEKFKEVCEAYEVLSNVDKRADYDNPNQRMRFSGSPFDAFSQFFNNRQQESSYDSAVRLDVEFEEAIVGCKKSISVPAKSVCKKCNAAGFLKSEQCKRCNGQGSVVVNQRNWQLQMECPDCNGEGSIFSDKCDQCQDGFNPLPDEVLEVDIPAGIDNGNVLRLAGKGEYNNVGGRGNLHVVVSVKPHAVLMRKGFDLFCKVPVSYSQLFLGGTVTVPIVGGSVNAKIPPRTAVGSKLKLRGQGVKFKRGHGDMILILDCPIPKDVPKEYLEKLKELAELESKHPAKELVDFSELIKSKL